MYLLYHPVCYLNNNLNININIIIAHEHATNDNFADRGKMSTMRDGKLKQSQRRAHSLSISLSPCSIGVASALFCWVARERIVCAAQSQEKKGAINVRCTWTMTHWYRHFDHCQSIVLILICLFRALFVCAPISLSHTHSSSFSLPAVIIPYLSVVYAAYFHHFTKIIANSSCFYSAHSPFGTVTKQRTLYFYSSLFAATCQCFEICP